MLVFASMIQNFLVMPQQMTFYQALMKLSTPLIQEIKLYKSQWMDHQLIGNCLNLFKKIEKERSKKSC